MSNIETASQTGLHFGVFSLSPSDRTALRIYRRRLYFRMIPRKLGIPQFFIDTNCVNARCGNEAINILEKWDNDGVISIRMPWDAQLEAKRGNNYQRRKKALSHIAPLPLPETSEERNTLTTITKTIFGKKVLSDQDRRDVLIVFTAEKYCAVLVTNDGAILRAAKALHIHLSVQVMTPEQAVSMVRIRIAERDGIARRDADREGMQIPEWVGRD